MKPAGSVSVPDEADSDTSARILVVDDNKDAAQSLALLLELRGHHVKTAHDGANALLLAPGFLPKIILLDIGLPDSNGYEMARRIREQAWGRNVLLVALTGWGQNRDKIAATQAGFDHHLTKPLVLHDLIAILDRAAKAT